MTLPHRIMTAGGRRSPVRAAVWLALSVAATVAAGGAVAQTPMRTPLDTEPNAPGLNESNSGLANGYDRGRYDAARAKVSRIEIVPSTTSVAADGRSLVHVHVRLLDSDGQPLAADVPLSIDTSHGRVVAPGLAADALEAALDRDLTAGSIQLLARGGETDVDLVAPNEPGEARLRATVAGRQQTVTIDCLPELRELIAAGIVEGTVNLSHRSTGAGSALPGDGFEQEIHAFARESGSGDVAAGARAAFFLRGTVGRDALLTAAYDSETQVSNRLFRDIQTDRLYPVYGDASIKGYDAPVNGRLYVRVDERRSYLLYGDFNSSTTIDPAAQLSRYSRSLTGLKGHWEEGTLALDAFASRGTMHQIVDQLPGRGISGPYQLSRADGVLNSEKIEVIVRDRNAPTVVLSVTPQTRYIDYDFEPLSGLLLFKSPVPSLDANLNPVSIRVSYEVEEGGADYWVAGASANAQVLPGVRLGASYDADENPLAKYRLAGASVVARAGEHTRALAEFAHSDNADVTAYGSATALQAAASASSVTGLADSGSAWRAEVVHEADGVSARAYVRDVGPGFYNPSDTTAGVAGNGALREAGGKASVKVAPDVKVVAEVVTSQDLLTDGERSGERLAAQWEATQKSLLQVGLRHAEQHGAGATLAATALPGSGIDPNNGGQTLLPNLVAGSNLGTALNAPYNVTTANARYTYRPTGASSVFAEGETSVSGDSAHAIGVGGDYRVGDLGRLYAHGMQATGLGGEYGLAGSGKQNAVVVGIEDQYSRSSQVFSEYRLRDAINGEESEAAIGLRSQWPVAPGVRLSTSAERVTVFSGPASNTATALGAGVTYTGSNLWKGSARLEWRNALDAQSWLSTLAAARRVSDDWTLLARNYWYLQDGTSVGFNRQDRLQLGLAWRQTGSNVWNALAQYQLKDQYRRTAVTGQTTPDLLTGLGSGAYTLGANEDSLAHIVSTDLDYHPTRAAWYGAKVAAEWRRDLIEGSSQTTDAELLQARAIYDVTARWDVGVIGNTLRTNGAWRNGISVEVGRIVVTNLWLSLGVNLTELNNRDLAQDYSSRGIYLKMRFKFDQNLLTSTAHEISRRGEPGDPTR